MLKKNQFIVNEIKKIFQNWKSNRCLLVDSQVSLPLDHNGLHDLTNIQTALAYFTQLLIYQVIRQQWSNNSKSTDKFTNWTSPSLRQLKVNEDL